MISIKKGLDIPITGDPVQQISEGNPIKSVAVVGTDYVGMKPTMEVQVGDEVKLGQVLFTDKKTPGVRFTAPGAGKITAINRGEKRVLQSVVIELNGSEEEIFKSYSEQELQELNRDQIVENLVNSGLWTSFRTRPYSKIPPIESEPKSIFVTAMDTNPLAGNPEVVLNEQRSSFTNGLKVISKLTEGKTFLCKAQGAKIPGSELDVAEVSEFGGVHPAGLAGTHIHYLDPVSIDKTVWSIGYQDVVAIGHLFITGKLFIDRVISLAGPEATNPRLIRTRLGANTDELIAGEISEKENRVISGSVLNGHNAKDVFAFLGRYHNQISVLLEGYHRELLGWLSPGFGKFSVKNLFFSKLIPGKKFSFTTSEEGNQRAMVPVGAYEKVMPLDIQPTFLLRSLIMEDTDKAQMLGCLELDEEDLGLCTFVCPGKYNYGSILRNNLTRIERQG